MGLDLVGGVFLGWGPWISIYTLPAGDCAPCREVS